MAHVVEFHRIRRVGAQEEAFQVAFANVPDNREQGTLCSLVLFETKQ